MLDQLFKNRWSTVEVSSCTGAFGCASVELLGLVCRRHKVSGQLGFAWGFGEQLANWLGMRWGEIENRPDSLVEKSPWRWSVEIAGYPPLSIKVSYSKTIPIRQMESDTLDAILSALRNAEKNPETYHFV